jgi:hypothetical protein
MAVQDTVQAIAGLRPLANQPLPVGDQGPQLTDPFGRHPHGRNEPRREEAREFERVVPVGFDCGRTNPFDEQRIGDGHGGDSRSQLVVEMPGVERGFEHDRIRRMETRLLPGRELVPGQPYGTQHDLLLRIHGPDRHGPFVDVQTDEAGDLNV